MSEAAIEENWTITSDSSELRAIHEPTVNIAICERDVTHLESEAECLLQEELTIKCDGTVQEMKSQLGEELGSFAADMLYQDVVQLLNRFAAITQESEFRLTLTTVNTNMCGRFHADINKVRLLCTYTGPGTLWLANDNVDRKALRFHGTNDDIVQDFEDIRQVATGHIALLKGAIYPQKPSNPVVHRSPTIEETGEKRLLLRIDIGKFPS